MATRKYEWTQDKSSIYLNRQETNLLVINLNLPIDIHNKLDLVFADSLDFVMKHE
jgi:hypothetical protein